MRTGSATMPSIFRLLIFSMTAQGNVSSWPNKIPIFFIPLGSSQRSVSGGPTLKGGGNGITEPSPPAPLPRAGEGRGLARASSKYRGLANLHPSPTRGRGAGGEGTIPPMRRWIALARQELLPLILLVLIAGGVWLFIALADEVAEGGTRTVDRAVLLALRDPSDLSDPIGPPWMEEAVRDFTGLGSTAVLALLTLAVCGFLVLDGKRRVALLVVAAVAGGLVGGNLLKTGFHRPRTELVPHRVVVSSSSFPSGHSMNAAATYLTLGALLARIQKRRRLRVFILSFAALLTLLVGVSRIYLGVHWPTDVLAGWTAGGVWAFLCWMVALRLQRRGTIEKPGEGGEPETSTA